MDAYDEGSNARHGPDGPDGRTDPRDPLPGEVPETDGPPRPPRPTPYDSAAAAGPADAGSEPDADVPGRRAAAQAATLPEPDDGPAPDRYGASVPGPRAFPPSGPQVLGPDPVPLAGVAALSLRYRIGVALALAVVAVGVCVHLGMTFLHVAPANTLTKDHGQAVDDWIYPEFEQNWKLFAPNPLQQNIAIQARAEIRAADGGTLTTGWYDLSAEDGRAIDGNLLPSHTQQNELRRAWDFFVATHDNGNRPVGLRGTLSETYLRRIVVLRLDRDDAARDTAGRGGAVERVQVRSRTSNVPPPEWSDEKVSTTPVYRELPWWPVPEAEAGGGVR